jgi:hypothetical protein
MCIQELVSLGILSTAGGATNIPQKKNLKQKSGTK